MNYLLHLSRVFNLQQASNSIPFAEEMWFPIQSEIEAHLFMSDNETAVGPQTARNQGVGGCNGIPYQRQIAKLYTGSTNEFL